MLEEGVKLLLDLAHFNGCTSLLLLLFLLAFQFLCPVPQVLELLLLFLVISVIVHGVINLLVLVVHD